MEMEGAKGRGILIPMRSTENTTRRTGEGGRYKEERREGGREGEGKEIRMMSTENTVSFL